MPVPSRSIGDHFAEFVCVLGLLAGTCGKIGREIYTLMKTEYGELEEPVPAGTVGSSTMPHKRNPQLCQDVLGITAEIRSLVPLALEAMQGEHEADHCPGTQFEAITKASILTGEVLERIRLISAGLRLKPQRMRSNLELSGGLISSEAIMLALGKTIGRQHAHAGVERTAGCPARRVIRPAVRRCRGLRRHFRRLALSARRGSAGARPGVAVPSARPPAPGPRPQLCCDVRGR